jgi:hypothetical protein
VASNLPIFVSFSRAGGHADNEDAFAVLPHPGAPDLLLCAVADGQGGQPGGGPAARLACSATIEAASRARPADLLRPETWADLLGEADRAVARDDAAGYTTLVALCVQGDALCGASSGDSGAAVVSAGQAGVILTARQVKNPPGGSGAALFVPFACRLLSPWTVLALTDGVWKYTGWEAVLSAAGLPSPAEVIDELLRRATLPGSGGLQDDFTLVVLRG